MNVRASSRFAVYALGCLVVLGIAGYFSYRHFVPSGSLCQNVAAGASLDTLTRVISNSDAYYSFREDGDHTLIEHFVSGGIGCYVETKGGRVVSASLAGQSESSPNTSLERTRER